MHIYSHSPPPSGWRPLLLALTALAAWSTACGGTTPTSPTSTTTPPASTSAFHGVVIDTVNGAAVADVTVTTLANGRITVAAPGYLTHENVAASATTVDLIPTAAPFDLEFYRQLARGTLSGPAAPLRILAASPNVYLQTTGTKAATVTAYKSAAQQLIPLMSGGRLHLGTWETGDDVRPEVSGSIVIELVNDAGAPCGRTNAIGAAAGHIWLNTATGCRQKSDILPPTSVFAHELGHALGFSDVAAGGTLMNAAATQATPSDAEQYHALLAYRRHAGNRDVDVDP